jgi:predicted DNA-binding transcriptional regulator YafY
MEKCNIALENAGYDSVSSKNTILSDLEGIERDFPEASIKKNKVGRYVSYEYEDKSFSIYKIPLDDDGMAKLAQTIAILSRFEGLPNFEWVDEMIDHFRSSLNIPSTKETIVLFDENYYLRNRQLFSPLFSAIASEQALHIVYEPYGKSAITYDFHPYFLKQYNNRWFLLGCVEGYNTLTNFPFDRIKSIEPANIHYRPNTQFDFNELFEDVVGVSLLFDKPEEILLSVSPQTFEYIVTKPINPTQKPYTDENGNHFVKANVVINRELTQLILSYGAAVTVLKPQRLVDAIMQELQDSLKKYQCVQINCTDSV